MPEQEFKERRKSPRFAVTISLDHSHLSPEEIKKARTKDISAQGIGLITSEELIPNIPIELWLNMPDNGEQIHVKGKVIWLMQIEPDNYRVGIDLKDTPLKPIPLVLRIVKTKL